MKPSDRGVRFPSRYLEVPPQPIGAPMRSTPNPLLSLSLLLVLLMCSTPCRSSAEAPDQGWKLQSLTGMNQPVIETLLALNRHHTYVKQKTHADVAKMLRENGWKLVDSVVESKKFIRGYVARKDQDLVIAFRGTGGANGWQTFRNWVTDFRFLVPERPTFLAKPRKRKAKDLYEGVKGHRGFIEAYDSVRSEILKRVRANRSCRIWVTGSSLGGALANLCALDLRVNLGVQVGVAPFANPRVGYKKYHELYARMLPQAIRVVLNEDPVPRVPNDARFYHDGRLLQLYPNGVPVPLDEISGKLVGKAFEIPEHDCVLYGATLREFRKRWLTKLRTTVDAKWVVAAARSEEANRQTVRHIAPKVVDKAKEAGKAIGEGAKKAGKAIGEGAKKAGKTVRKVFTRKKKKEKD